MSQATATGTFPEELLVALFWQLGSLGQKEFDEEDVKKQIFTCVAEWDGPWREFKKNHQYYDSPGLSAALLGLIQGSSIVRLGATGKIESQPHLLGSWGKRTFDSLSPKLRTEVVMVAEWIRRAQ